MVADWQAYFKFLPEILSDDPAALHAGWTKIAASLEQARRKHPRHAGILRDLVAAYAQLIAFERGSARAANLALLIPNTMVEYEAAAGELPAEDAAFFHRALAALYLQEELYPLAAAHLGQTSEDEEKRLLQDTLAALGQAEFAERENFRVPSGLLPYRVTVYEAQGQAPDARVLFHRWYFVTRPDDGSNAPGQVWYTLSEQQLADAPRYYLYGHSAGLKKALALYGQRRPSYEEVRERVKELVLGALSNPAPHARSAPGDSRQPVLLASARPAGLFAPGPQPAKPGTGAAAPAPDEPDDFQRYQDALKYLGQDVDPVHPDTPLLPPAARVVADPAPVPVLAPAFEPPRSPQAAAPARQAPTGSIASAFQPVQRAREQAGGQVAAAVVRRQVGERIQAAAGAGSGEMPSPGERRPLTYRVGLSLQQLYAASGSGVQVPQGERPLSAPLPEISARLRDEAAAKKVLDGSRDRPEMPVHGSNTTGTRFFGDAGSSMDDAGKVVRTSRFPREVPPPPPPAPGTPAGFQPGGVLIAIDDEVLAAALRQQGLETSLEEIEALEERLLTARDGRAAAEALTGYADARQQAYLEQNAKFRSLGDARQISLRALLTQLAPYRTRWQDRPAALRALGGLTRIHGFMRRADGDLLLVGRAEPGAPPIQLDDLIVGLRTAWQRGLTPGCSLDPDPGNMAGPQYSAVIGVPDDSRFAKVMLEADYAMKRILFKVKGEEMDIPGYRSFVDLALQNPTGASARSRFWLYPVQPAAHEIQLGPGGGSGLFDARVQVLTEDMAVGERGLVGLAQSSPVDREAAASFSQHYDAIAARRPVFRELRSLFDIVLLARVLRLAAPRDLLLSELAALSYEPAAVPKSYAGITVRHASEGVTLVVSGGCDMRMRAGARSFIECRSRAIQALAGGGQGAQAGTPLLLPDAEGVSGGELERAYDHGMALMAGEKFAEAREEFSRAIALDPQFAAAYAQRAVARFEMGERRQAITDALAASLMDPRDVSLRAVFRRLLLEAGVPGALDGIDGALRSEIAAQYMASASMAATAGASDKALKASSYAVQADPRSALACAQRAALRLLRRDLDGALADANQATRNGPREILALQVRAAVRFFRADFAGAAADMDRVIRIREDPEFVGFRGLIRLFAGDVGGAVADAERSIRLAPTSQKALTTTMAIQMCARVGPEKMRAMMGPMLRLPPEILLQVAEGFEATEAGQARAAVVAFGKTLALLDQQADDAAVKQAGLLRDQIYILLLIQFAEAGPGMPGDVPAGPGTGALFPPGASPRERIDRVFQLLRSRHADWVTPWFARAMAMQKLGDIAEATAALDTCLRMDAARDPMLGVVFGAAEGSFRGFVLLLKLAFCLIRPGGPDMDGALRMTDQLAQLLRNSRALPACLGLHDAFQATRAHPESMKSNAPPPGALEAMRRRQRELGDLSKEAMPALDAAVVTMFLNLIVDMETRQGPNLDRAEAAARSLFQVRVLDELSPVAQGMPQSRALTCVALIRAYADRERLTRYLREDPEAGRAVVEAAQAAEKDPTAVPALYEKAFASWIRRADGLGEPAFGFLMRDLARQAGQKIAQQALEERVLRLGRLMELAESETARAQLAAGRTEAEKRRDEFARRQQAALGAQIRAAYGKAQTLIQVRTLDLVLAEAGRRAQDMAPLYRPPDGLPNLALRTTLQVVARRYGKSNPGSQARAPRASAVVGKPQPAARPGSIAANPRSGPATRKPPAAAPAKPPAASSALPWAATPQGPAWEALGWVPAGEEVAILLFDYPIVRGARAHWIGMDVADGMAAVWGAVVHGLGIPETSLGEVVAVERGRGERRRVYVCRTSLPVDEVARLLQARGLTESRVAGARAWKRGDADAPGVAFVDGWIVEASSDPPALERILNARAAREPSVRSAKGVRELMAALPGTLPVEIGVGPFHDRDAPAARAIARWRDTGSGREMVAMAFETEASAQRFGEQVKPFMAMRPESISAFQVETRGTVGRLTLADGVHLPGAMEGAARADLGKLAEALRRFEREKGRSPTMAEGLAALTGEAGYLDAFVGEVPVDPWGHPYRYTFPRPGSSDGFVLRSAGPDGKPDTLDDIVVDVDANDTTKPN
jgi:tetratricopeptide (TPR) repeat protein